MMMNYPLLLRNILERARLLYGKKEIVSREINGIHRYTYQDFYRRVCRLAHVLEKLGIKRGDRVGTLAWNSHRHLELYFAVPCTGAVLHTLNLRLFVEQLTYIVNHAEDKVIFFDADLLPLILAIRDRIPTVEHFIVLHPDPSFVPPELPQALNYEKLLTEVDDDYEFPRDLDEFAPAAMCYTTATTGDPKGVVYTQRSIFLHSFALLATDMMGLREKDTTMPVVPMFHVNAWGIPFAATWAGAKQVYPGPRPDAVALCQLIQNEKVTLSAGVPTIWMAVLQEYQRGGYDFSSVRCFIVGGAAVPRALMEAYDKIIGTPLVHAYGMTETSPLVLLSQPKSYMEDWPPERVMDVRIKQGVPAPGLEVKIVNEKGEEVPHDGRTMGELLVRGPWIAGGYYRDPERSAQAVKDGWLHTGDIATIDEEGYVAICDRVKDLIKSGGEWISSVDLENTIMAHPAVAEAAVIGIPHEKWQERPMACVVLKPDYKDKVKEEDIIAFLTDRVAKWWLPDRVVFVDEIPKTSVGKFDKKVLRARFASK